MVESGRHEDLIRAGGRYSALASRDALLSTAEPQPATAAVIAAEA